MKDIAVLALCLSVPLVCVSGAVWLLAHDKPGWGWLLFVAVLLGATRVSVD